MKSFQSILDKLHAGLHHHLWLFGGIGLGAGLFLMLFVPSLQGVSQSLLYFAFFHLAGAVIVLATLYNFFGFSKLARGRHRSSSQAQKPDRQQFDFGWESAWMNGLGIAALIALSFASAVQVSLPQLWPLAFVFVALAVCFAAGNHIMHSFRQLDRAILPGVCLTQVTTPLVLDAGCGAGRTTIAISRMIKNARIVAIDRFDATYIDGGGKALLKKNLQIAALGQQVEIKQGDLSAPPFADNSFDAAVSTNVFDHLGKQKCRAMQEIFRVLQPGGRFLVCLWVPSWGMFAVGNLFSFLLTGKKEWRRLAQDAGFALVDEGICNHAWFMLLEKTCQ